MNEKERDAFAVESEQQIRGQEARLAMAEAHAREVNATEQLKELTGLKALQSKLREHFTRFKDANRDQWDVIRTDFEKARQEFANKLDAVKAKLNQIENVRGERFDAQLDQLDEEIVALDAKVRVEAIELKAEDAQELQQVHEKLDVAKEERRRVAAARDESRQEVKASFGRAMEDLKQTWQRARDRVESARHGAS